jgi:hypothetical protein
VAMTQALESALKAHPVGLFWPKAKKFLPGQPIKFLGHLLTPKHGGHVHIAPSPENRAKFEAEMASKLKRLKTKKMPDVMARERQQARHYVRSWTAAFSLSEGIEDERNYWMQRIKATTPLSASIHARGGGNGTINRGQVKCPADTSRTSRNIQADWRKQRQISRVEVG